MVSVADRELVACGVAEAPLAVGSAVGEGGGDGVGGADAVPAGDGEASPPLGDAKGDTEGGSLPLAAADAVAAEALPRALESADTVGDCGEGDPAADAAALREALPHGEGEAPEEAEAGMERVGEFGEEEGCTLREGRPLALPLGVELPDTLPLRLTNVVGVRRGEREPVAVAAGEPVGLPGLPLAGAEALGERDAVRLLALEREGKGEPLCVWQPEGDESAVGVPFCAPLGLARGEEEGRAVGLSGPLRVAEGVAQGDADADSEGAAVRVVRPPSRTQ
jgi:hypothetical protein